MKRFLRNFSYFRIYIYIQLKDFLDFLFYYIKTKIVNFSIAFEKYKNKLVKFFLMKRGRYNRPFLHLTTIGILGLGVMIAPFLSDTFPIFTNQAAALDLSTGNQDKQSVLAGEEVFQTKISEKPRDSIIEYTIEKGDTISTVAKKFKISENSIKWENNLTGDNLSIGETLRIVPVTGLSHKVLPGDTVYSIAKKYNTNPQSIVDWPFNEFASPETFTLISGQIIIVPDGIKPSEQKYFKPQVYIAQGPIPVAGGGFTYPVRGGISTFFSYYHPGVDITAPLHSPLVAAHSGTVTKVSVGTWDGGFGTNIYISNGAGIESHYAHMSGVNVSVGQSVVGGSSVIGWIGMTGRTTGPHVHFEMRQNGAAVNPLGYVQ